MWYFFYFFSVNTRCSQSWVNIKTGVLNQESKHRNYCKRNTLDPSFNTKVPLTYRFQGTVDASPWKYKSNKETSEDNENQAMQTLVIPNKLLLWEGAYGQKSHANNGRRKSDHSPKILPYNGEPTRCSLWTICLSVGYFSHERMRAEWCRFQRRVLDQTRNGQNWRQYFILVLVVILTYSKMKFSNNNDSF